MGYPVTPQRFQAGVAGQTAVMPNVPAQFTHTDGQVSISLRERGILHALAKPVLVPGSLKQETDTAVGILLDYIFTASCCLT